MIKCSTRLEAVDGGNGYSNEKLVTEYVQYGCGLCAPRSWLNFDCSPSLKLQRIPGLGWVFRKVTPPFPPHVRSANIVKGLPVSINSCTAIYCSHVLEHLALADLEIALRHTYEYLRPDGTFRLVVPDLQALARAYVSSSDPLASLQFMEAAGIGRKERRRGIVGLMRTWLGNSAHLWMWDERSLSLKLQEHGFRSIRRAHFGDAEDPRFADVEDAGRFSGAVALQCRK